MNALTYIRTEFYAGPKDGDRRVCDRVTPQYFESQDVDHIHMYAFAPGKDVMAYLGYVERGNAGVALVQELIVGSER